MISILLLWCYPATTRLDSRELDHPALVLLHLPEPGLGLWPDLGTAAAHSQTGPPQLRVAGVSRCDMGPKRCEYLLIKQTDI